MRFFPGGLTREISGMVFERLINAPISARKGYFRSYLPNLSDSDVGFSAGGDVKYVPESV